MRDTHDGKPSCAVGRPISRWYFRDMNFSRLPTALRSGAFVVLGATLIIWIATGRHLGWTQTTITTLHTDEFTGIEYPVHQPGFVAGVEVLAIGIAVATALGALSWFAHRRARARA